MNPTNILEIFTQARSTCRELLVMLTEENSGLARHNVAEVETRIQHKRRLTLRLEQLLAEVKKSSPLWKSDRNAQTQAFYLAEEIRHFQDLARQNVQLLKAAHQLRADLIMSIRDTVESAQPRVQTYTPAGMLNQSQPTARIMAREV